MQKMNKDYGYVQQELDNYTLKCPIKIAATSWYHNHEQRHTIEDKL